MMFAQIGVLSRGGIEPPIPPSYENAAFSLAGTSYGQVSTRQVDLEPSIASADRAMSWSGWFRPSNVGTGLQRAFGVADPAGAAQQYTLVVRSATESGALNQCWQFGIFNGANFIRVVSTTRALKNRWAHITVTYSGSEAASGFELYINGVRDTTATKDSGGTYTGAVNNAAYRMMVSSTNGSRFRGNVRDLAIWNRVLTQGEVTELFNSGVPLDVTTATFYGSAITALWPLHTDGVCPNNASFNFSTLNIVTFGTRPLSPYYEGLTIFNAAVGNTRYIAFGGFIQNSSGQYSWYGRSGTAHLTGGNEVKIPFNADTLTPGTVLTVIDDATYDLRGGSIGIVDNEIVNFNTLYNSGTSQFFDSNRYESTDGLTGETFAAGIQMEVAVTNVSSNFYGKVFECYTAGDYLVPYHNYWQDLSLQEIYVWKRTSGTWSKKLVCTGDNTDGYNEMALLKAGDGYWIGLIRAQISARLELVYSTDDGETWSAPANTGLSVGIAMADMCVDPAGRIVVAFADRGDGWLKISKDNELADIIADPTDWNAPSSVWQTIDESINILGYPSIMNDGWKFAIAVSSEQNPPSATRADLFFGYGLLGAG